MAQSEIVHWVVIGELVEGKDAEFEVLMAEMVAVTESEAGCLAYEWHRNGRKVHIYERYATNADAGLHLQNFAAHFAKRFSEILAPKGFNVYGPVAAPVRAGLEKSGARFFDRVGGFSR